jgi:hypothetical protein
MVTSITYTEPATFSHAANQQFWREAMKVEYDSIMCNDVWEVVPRLEGKLVVTYVDDYSCVRHSLGHKPERESLRGVYGSYLKQSWNVKMASSLQRVKNNSK